MISDIFLWRGIEKTNSDACLEPESHMYLPNLCPNLKCLFQKQKRYTRQGSPPTARQSLGFVYFQWLWTSDIGHFPLLPSNVHLPAKVGLGWNLGISARNFSIVDIFIHSSDLRWLWQAVHMHWTQANLVERTIYPLMWVTFCLRDTKDQSKNVDHMPSLTDVFMLMKRKFLKKQVN